ncbi:MAG: Zn-ribbon domain-containing OB-fold protein [Ktedonobacteraceae bacterium]
MPEGVRSKPLPVVTEVSRPFWEGCRSGILRLQYCDQCQQHQFYPRLYCMHCGFDKLSWVAASGRGVIYSYTIIHQNKSPEFVQDTPYNVAIIQLAEGPRMVSNIVGISLEDLRIDLPVKIVFDPVTDTISIPRFEPLA